MKRPRLYGWHYSHLLVQYISLRELKKAFSSFLCGTAIDIGCGEKPFREFIAPFAGRYYGIDFPGTMHPKTHLDVFSVAYSLPFKDRSIDSVLLTAVLEHLEEPQDAVNECARVLRQGGCVIATVPLFWQLH
jgi:SAM-dependent methyltransferase